MIQSVDSVRLAEALAARAEGRRVPLLLEVYLGDDPARPGFRPDDVEQALASIAALPGLDVRGLMTVAPLGLTGRRRSGAVFRRAARASRRPARSAPRRSRFTRFRWE